VRKNYSFKVRWYNEDYNGIYRWTKNIVTTKSEGSKEIIRIMPYETRQIIPSHCTTIIELN
jgi:hypothetical protein